MSSSAGELNSTSSLQGQRILIVEDQFLIAVELQDCLENAGATVVGPVGRLDRALSKATDGSLHAALLDVDLNGERCWPVADALQDAGVPFAFTTGFSASIKMPDRFAKYPVVSKSYREGEVLAVLRKLLGLS
jgi:DNA-binding response OmpR family regulator